MGILKIDGLGVETALVYVLGMAVCVSGGRGSINDTFMALTAVDFNNPFRTAAPFWGQTS